MPQCRDPHESFTYEVASLSTYCHSPTRVLCPTPASSHRCDLHKQDRRTRPTTTTRLASKQSILCRPPGENSPSEQTPTSPRSQAHHSTPSQRRHMILHKNTTATCRRLCAHVTSRPRTCPAIALYQTRTGSHARRLPRPCHQYQHRYNCRISRA
jgi:hypothetical protein